MTRSIFLSFVVTLLVLTFCPIGYSAIPNHITIEGERVSLAQISTTRLALLSAIASESRLKIIIFGNIDDDPINFSASQRPLSVVLQSLLKGVNYATVSMQVGQTGEVQVISSAGDVRKTKKIQYQATAISSYQQDNSGRRTYGGRTGGDPARGSARKMPERLSTQQTMSANGENMSLIPYGVSSGAGSAVTGESIPDADVVSSWGGSSTAGDWESLSTETGSELSDNDTRKMKLQYRIDRLQADIDSGAANDFFERWSAIKDPKYVFNHQRELERLQAEFAKLN